jgi:hypothetical protein
MRDLTTLDRLKGDALVCTFLGFLATCAALVSWWDTTWRVAVEPTRANVYSAQHDSCARSFGLATLIMGAVAVGGFSADMRPFRTLS